MKKKIQYCAIILLILTITLSADIKKSRFFPDHCKFQFAGNQGLISFGPGYHFFKHRVEIDLMYGYLPQSIAGADIHSVTVKRTALLLNIHPHNRWEIQALLDLSTIYTITKNTHLIWPEYFPDNYYPPNAIHNQISFGLRLDYNSPDNYISQKISFYYELGLLDDHLYYYLKTGRGDISEKLNIALGMRIDLKKIE